jgi:hypothetical protein
MRASRRRKLLGVAVVLLLSLLAGDALLGLGVSVLNRQRSAQTRMLSQMNNLLPHPLYIWTYQPNTEVWMSAEGISLPATINHDGLRDKQGRPDGRYFLGMGDSFTFGWLVALPDTWHKRLAHHLSEGQKPPIASVNLGMWMSTFPQHYLRLREMLDRYPRPEFVVHPVYPSHIQTVASFILDLNAAGDIQRARSLLLHIRNGEMYYGADLGSLMERQLSWPYSAWVLRRWATGRKFRELYEQSVGPLAGVNDLNLYTGDRAEVFAAAWEKTARSLAATARLLRERKIPYYVVIVPRDLQVAESEWNGKPPDSRILRGDLPQQKLLAICRDNNITCLDLLPHFRAAAPGSSPLYFSSDPHWTPAGHDLAARVLADFMQGRDPAEAKERDGLH